MASFTHARDGAHDSLSGRAPAAGSIQRVLVLADGTKDRVERMLPRIRAWLEREASEVAVVQQLADFPSGRESKSTNAERPDLVLVLGGDGSVLTAVRAFADHPVPTLGVNFGRVGFLAPVEAQHWENGLRETFEGRAVLEPRMRFEASMILNGVEQDQREVALNDLVLGRGATQGMVSIALRVNGEWASEYRADGLIIATPSGSTAYSLASGGPVLAPSMEAIVVTPIAAHALSHRPLVLHPGSRLEAVVEQADGPVQLFVDGQSMHSLEVGDRVVIRRHPIAYPLLALADVDPWQRLRERLGWRGSFEH